MASRPSQRNFDASPSSRTIAWSGVNRNPTPDRHGVPAEPLDRLQPVPPGDEFVCGRDDQWLQKPEAADAVNEIVDLGFGNGSAQVADRDPVDE